jgi:hypothetical protein
MEALTIYPNTKEQENLYKQLAKTLQNRIEKKEVESPYNSEFVTKIKQGQKEKKAGQFKIIQVDDLWK